MKDEKEAERQVGRHVQERDGDANSHLATDRSSKDEARGEGGEAAI
jgi:hypothetical protein